MMDLIGLSKFRDEPVRNLSQGNQRKLEMLIKILTEPCLLGINQ